MGHSKLASFFAKMPFKTKVFWSILVFFTLFYLWIAIGNHFFYKSFGFDYGLFNQMLWKYAHFKLDNTLFHAPISNSLQDHFSLTMFFFVPVYWVLGTWLTQSYTLLLIQVCFVVLGAVGTYKWVRFKTNNEWISIAALFHFFTIQGVLTVFTNDYHDIVVGSCAIPFFLYYLESKQFWKTIPTLFFIITSKENMPIVMSVVLLVFLISDWKDPIKRKNSLYLLSICLIYSVVLFNWLIPMVTVSGQKSWVFKYYYLGNSLKEVAVHLITHPLKAFNLLFVNQFTDAAYNGIKTEFYMAFFIFWGGLFLILKPKYYLIFIPLIAQKAYSEIQVMWGIYAYYSIEICALLVGLVFISLASIKNGKVLKILTLLVVMLNLTFTIHFVTGGSKVNWMANTEKLNLANSKFYKNHPDVIHYKAISEIIPDTASVSCTQNFSSHFSGRDQISIFPNLRHYNYVIIDSLDAYPSSIETINERKRELMASGKWTTLYEKDRFVVLKRHE